jgi:integrase
MVNQGCRPEELLELRKDAVDLEYGLMRIVRGKSKAAKRTLKLTPESAFLLEARMQGNSPWIFPSPKREGHHLTKLNTAHDKVIKETGLAFVIYDFRHTCATRWAERGMDLGTLAKLLGHSSLRSVMKYVHISQEHMNQAMDRYGEGHPENQTSTSEVGLRSVAATKEGIPEQMSVIEHKLTGVRNLQETKGKIQ